MIKLTRMNGAEILINPDLIETVEHPTDTVITLTTNNKLMVREDLAEISRRVLEFRMTVAQGKKV